MTTHTIAHQKISSSLLTPAIRTVHERMVFFFNHRVLTGVCAVWIILGAVLYTGLLFMSFDLGVRLREVSLATGNRDKEVQRMEVREREQEAGFSVRNQAFLTGMQETAAIKYLTPESATVSEAKTVTPFRQ